MKTRKKLEVYRLFCILSVHPLTWPILYPLRFFIFSQYNLIPAVVKKGFGFLSMHKTQ